MDKKVSKRLPYGNTNFESLRTENYVYIDKTRYIELLENEGNENLFLLVRVNSEKVCFFSTLSYYYDITTVRRPVYREISYSKTEQLYGS
jgi:hypothetical protein